MDFPHNADITIIGKHTNAYQFLHAIKGTTIGLNQAALAHKTDFAMTGHQVIYNMLKCTEYHAERIIATNPMFEPPFHVQAKHHINYLHKPDIINLTPYTYEKVAHFVNIAISRGLTANYPNWWTILHLAMFFALAHNPKSITIIGCDNTPAPYSPYPDMLHHDYVRQHTHHLVNATNAAGISCNWLTLTP